MDPQVGRSSVSVEIEVKRAMDPQVGGNELKEKKAESRKPFIFQPSDGNSTLEVCEPYVLKLGPNHDSSMMQLQLDEEVLKWMGCTKDQILTSMKGITTDARAYYQDADKDGFPKDDEFLEIMARDGCFILKIMHLMIDETHDLKAVYNSCRAYIYDPQTLPQLRLILLDLLHFKNQIPMLVLRELHKLIYPKIAMESLGNMLNNFLLFYFTDTALWGQELEKASDLLGAAIVKMLPKPVEHSKARTQHSWPAGIFAAHKKRKTSPHWQGGLSLWCSATDLKDAGVDITKSHNGRVTYEPTMLWYSRLLLPLILISRDSEFIFKNMVAYEQSLMDRGHATDSQQPASSYLRLLCDLIRSDRDVELLCWQGILINDVGNHQQVVELFKGLQTSDACVTDELSDTRRQINERYRNLSCWADLKRTYFRSPWAYCSFAAGIVLFILTLLQVVYAMLDYHLQGSKH